MRRQFKGFARGVLVVFVVLALGSSAEARSRDDRWDRERTPLLRIIKFAMKCFGDLITDPKP